MSTLIHRIRSAALREQSRIVAIMRAAEFFAFMEAERIAAAVDDFEPFEDSETLEFDAPNTAAAIDATDWTERDSDMFAPLF